MEYSIKNNYKKNRLVSNAAFAVLQVIISGGVLFFLYGYLLRSLGPDALGMWSLLMAATNVASISNLGLAGSLVSFVSKYLAEDEVDNAVAAIETTILSVAAVMGLVSVCLLPLLNDLLTLIIPVESVTEANTILPYAIVGLWFGSLGSAVHSALDGCHRADLRSISTILCQPVTLVGALWLSPSFGLMGLAYAQIAQYVIWILFGWIFLRCQIKQLPILPLRWHSLHFKKMWRYGVKFQLITIMVLLSEPLAKGVLSYYTNLNTVAYFEMANRLVLQVRGVLTSANQVITPYVSKMHATQPEKISEIYLQNLKWLSLAASASFSIVIAASTLISVIWLGQIESQFIIFLVILSIGCFFNTLGVPAYFTNLGMNNIKPNVWGHFATMATMGATASFLGPWFKPYGSAVAWPIGLIIGSYIINIGTMRYANIRKGSIIKQMKLQEIWKFFVIGGAAASISLILIKVGGADLVIMGYAIVVVSCAIISWRAYSEI